MTQSTKGGNVWFTSDLHFGHRFVAGLRGFDDVVEHDDVLTGAWIDRIRPDDQVWVLGDIAVSSPANALKLIDTLPGRKHLIAGNHDVCHPMHSKAHKKQRQYLEVFESVQAFSARKIAGQRVLLSHFPYEKDRHEARYMQYRLRDHGEWLLHGHTHEDVKRTSAREIHVGVDAWNLAPVSIQEIESIINAAS